MLSIKRYNMVGDKTDSWGTMLLIQRCQAISIYIYGPTEDKQGYGIPVWGRKVKREELDQSYARPSQKLSRYSDIRFLSQRGWPEVSYIRDVIACRSRLAKTIVMIREITEIQDAKENITTEFHTLGCGFLLLTCKVVIHHYNNTELSSKDEKWLCKNTLQKESHWEPILAWSEMKRSL